MAHTVFLVAKAPLGHQEIPYFLWNVKVGIMFFLTNATNCMAHTLFLVAKAPLGHQEIPYILWNVKVHYIVYKKPPVASCIQFTPSHRVFKYIFSIIFLFMSRYSKQSLFFSFAHQNLICTSLMYHPFHTHTYIHCPSPHRWCHPDY